MQSKKRHNRAILLVLTAVVLFCALLYGRMIIEGDGLTYYALARSAVEDGDFDLRNQRQQIPQLHLIISPVTRRIASRFSCGFGVLYAPFLFVSDWISSVWSGYADWTPYRQNEFIPFPHAAAVFTGSLIFGALTLFLTYRMLSRHTKTISFLPLLITLAAFIGTPLIFYVFTMPSYAHCADAFLTASGFYLAVAAPAFTWRGISLRNLLLGTALGLSVLLRNNNAVLILPLLFGLLMRTDADFEPQASNKVSKDSTVRDRMIACLQVFAGAAPFFALFVSFNHAQYGKWIATGYELQIDQWYLWNMLFHPDVSLFLWSPVALLGLIGLIIGAFRKHPEAIVALSCVALVLISVQFQPNWWGGCSFGTRFFTHLFVFWVWGIFEMLRRSRKTATAFLVLCCVWSFFLFQISFINSVSVDFRAKLRTNYCRRTPFEMIESAAEDYSRARQAGETENPLHFWLQCTTRGNYPTLLGLVLK
jgi:hypothetical protein